MDTAQAMGMVPGMALGMVLGMVLRRGPAMWPVS
jgi:hypothetical protein